MKFAIVLLFISFNVISFMHIDESYDIDIFLSDIIEKGFYYLFQDLKCFFNAEVAIFVCLDFYQTENCEKLIRNFISDCPPENSIFSFIERPTSTDEERKQRNTQKLINILKKYPHLITKEKLYRLVLKIVLKFRSLFSKTLNLIKNN